MGNATRCAVDGCAKPLKRAGYCYGHYMKNWRYGTPTPQHDPWREDLRGRRFGLLTVVDYVGNGAWLCLCDCGRKREAQAGALNRTGDAATCGDRREHAPERWSDSIGYNGAHCRVASARGRASEYACADCGKPAAHWSYDHEDPDERLAYGIKASPMPYSLDPEHYVPRCATCHNRFDQHRHTEM